MKKIAGIFKSDDMQGQLRYSGAINALKKHKFYCNQKKNMFWYTTEDIKLIMNGELDREILRRLNDATAIICYNDQIARLFSSIYLLRLIKKIPDDISIISLMIWN